MQDAELVDIFKNKKCKTCGADTVEYLQRYSKFNKCYYNLSEKKLQDYKDSMNREIKRIIKNKQAARENKNIESPTVVPEGWQIIDNGYDPFTMNISEEEYLEQKKSDVSDQTKTSDQ